MTDSRRYNDIPPAITPLRSKRRAERVTAGGIVLLGVPTNKFCALFVIPADVEMAGCDNFFSVHYLILIRS